jgi:hypothetical protein
MKKSQAEIDGLAKNHLLRWLRKRAKVKAREFRVARRTGSTLQRPRDEAQRRDWPSYEAIIYHSTSIPK